MKQKTFKTLKVDYEKSRRDRKRLLKIHEKAKEIVKITSQVKGR